MTPVTPLTFVDGYDFLAALIAWRAAGTPDERRHWSLSSGLRPKNTQFCCLLTFWRGDVQVEVRKHGNTAAEAVWYAVEEVMPSSAPVKPTLYDAYND
jgi:hypothetical protein